jgi:hypothetical protein
MGTRKKVVKRRRRMTTAQDVTQVLPAAPPAARDLWNGHSTCAVCRMIDGAVREIDGHRRCARCAIGR